jgi:hypothetical protein
MIVPVLSDRIPKHDKCLAVALRYEDPKSTGQRLWLGYSAVNETRNIGLEKGATLANLIDALPDGEQNRCHTPPYGLSFMLGDRMVWWLSVCWGCNNVASGDGLKYRKTFNGESEPAVRLLDDFNLIFNAKIDPADA